MGTVTLQLLLGQNLMLLGAFTCITIIFYICSHARVFTMSKPIRIYAFATASAFFYTTTTALGTSLELWGWHRDPILYGLSLGTWTLTAVTVSIARATRSRDHAMSQVEKQFSTVCIFAAPMLYITFTVITLLTQAQVMRTSLASSATMRSLAMLSEMMSLGTTGMFARMIVAKGEMLVATATMSTSTPMPMTDSDTIANGDKRWGWESHEKLAVIMATLAVAAIFAWDAAALLWPQSHQVILSYLYICIPIIDLTLLIFVMEPMITRLAPLREHSLLCVGPEKTTARRATTSRDICRQVE